MSHHVFWQSMKEFGTLKGSPEIIFQAMCSWFQDVSFVAALRKIMKNPTFSPTFRDVAEVPWGRVKFQLWQLHRCRSCRSEDCLDPLQGTSPKVLGILLWKFHLCISDVNKIWRATLPQTAGDVWVSNFLRAGNKKNITHLRDPEKHGKTTTLDYSYYTWRISHIFPLYRKVKIGEGYCSWDLGNFSGSWRRSHTAWPGGPSFLGLPQKLYGMSSKYHGYLWVTYVIILYIYIYITFKKNRISIYIYIYYIIDEHLCSGPAGTHFEHRFGWWFPTPRPGVLGQPKRTTSFCCRKPTATFEQCSSSVCWWLCGIILPTS